MIDTESTGLAPNSAVWEFYAEVFDLDDPDTVIREIHEYLPIEPQQMLGRTISAQWLLWILGQPVESHKDMLAFCGGDDIDELTALVRSISRKLTQEIESAAKYEVWFRRPQHDVPLLTGLLADCGESVPWKYDKVMDLATMMDLAGVKISDVDSTPYRKHTAYGDVKFGKQCYLESLRRIRALI